MQRTPKPRLNSSVRFLIAVNLLLTACGQDPATSPTQTEADTNVASDSSIADISAQPDTTAAEDTSIAPDVGSGNVCPGGSGCACAANDDCDSTMCIEGPDGKQCAQACVDKCDAGFSCAQVPQGSDVAVVCVSVWSRLCSPCEQTKDCNHPGVTSARCIEAGDAGKYCGTGCVNDDDCPTAHACKSAKDVDGNTAKQCLPVDSSGKLAACACSENAVALALKTPCSKSVAAGGTELVCMGQAQCKKAGEPALCQADAPALEKCDGLDNDCDGDTDEASCDDENVCTTDACDADKGCSNTPVDDGATCDADGSVCTVDDACKVGKCQAGAAKNCDDKNPCTKDSCDLAKGCTQVADDGVPCDDENPCTIGDVCASKTCKAGQPKVCTSTEFCVEAKCDLTKAGSCGFENKKVGTTCDDGDACTKEDGCVGGGCGGAKISCDDKNQCTDDSCDPKKGCVHKANTAPCDDGDKCTQLDACSGKLCAAGSAKTCDDTEVCTVDSCDSKTGDCVFSGLPKEATTCDADGSVCTVSDACKSGKCATGSAKNCEDGNKCTNDGCDAKTGCTHIPSTEACDADGSKCTVGDACKDKACVAGTAKNCEDSEICTVDSCDKKTGDCVFAGLPKKGAACDADGSVCTIGDACDAGKCAAGPTKKCDDANVCTTDSCHAKTGCSYLANTANCSDGNGCTVVDACKDKACVAGADKVCDDKQLCTLDSCESKTGDCVFAGLPKQATACDADGSVCTIGDACDSGKCKAGITKKCDDGNSCTDDGCDAKTGCTNTNNTAECGDKDACTDKDVCSGGVCAGSKVTCDDKNPCTTDTCDKAKGCQVVNVKDEVLCTSGIGVSWCQAGKCVPKVALGKACANSKQCSSGFCVDGVCCDSVCGKGCLSCLAKHTGAADGLCKPSMAGTDPDSECKTMDVSTCGFTGMCDGSAQCAKYKAGIVCKSPSCLVGGSHQAAGVCGANGCVDGKTTSCDDGNACTGDVCDAAKVCVHTETGKPCDDKNACANKDLCGTAGNTKTYVGSAPSGFGVCSGTKVICDDGNVCTADSCDQVKGCLKVSEKDGAACSQDGLKWCQAGACVFKPMCGDGVVNQTAEQCDDGNTKAGDGCSAACKLEDTSSCLGLLEADPDLDGKDGLYSLDPDGAGPSPSFSAYCDMTTDGGGWMWLGYGAKGTTSFSAWLSNSALNLGGIGKTISSWHLSSAQIGSLGTNARYRGGCSSQTNNYYWTGGGTWSWSARTPTNKCTAKSDGTGTSYATVWQDSCHWGVIAVGEFTGAHCNNGNSAVVNPWYCGKSHATNISLWGRPK